MNSKVLVLGDGLLASEIIAQTKWDQVSRKKDSFDITDTSTYNKMTQIVDGAGQSCPYDVILNCIGYTDTYNPKREEHWDVNYRGVSNLVEFCNYWKVKFVHISTDYVYTHSVVNASEQDVPVHAGNWYSYTKLLGDGHVQLKSNDYLLIRTTHKPTPFPYPKAWLDQVGNFDYAQNISKLILKLIENKSSGLFNVGTESKTMYDLAKRTNKDVLPVCEEYDKTRPYNLTMNIDKLNKELS